MRGGGEDGRGDVLDVGTQGGVHHEDSQRFYTREEVAVDRGVVELAQDVGVAIFVELVRLPHKCGRELGKDFDVARRDGKALMQHLEQPGLNGEMDLKLRAEEGAREVDRSGGSGRYDESRRLPGLG